MNSIKIQDELFERVSSLSEVKREWLERTLRDTFPEDPLARFIPRRPLTAAVPLSAAQQRLWMLHQLDPQSHVYNDFYAVRLTGPLHADLMEKSLNEIVHRHESLRTTFQFAKGELVQRIAPSAELKLPLTDLSALEETEREREAHRLAVEESHAPFDMARGPLLRGQILKVGEEEHLLLLTLHHIVCDMWTIGVLTAELGALYTAFVNGAASPLPPLKIQYGDYAYWQRHLLQGAKVKEQLAYWREQLRAPLPFVLVPGDRPRPAKRSQRGSTHSFSFSKELTDRLTAAAREQGVTLYSFLLAGYKVLLHGATGLRDLLVGAPIAGRTLEETEPLIGCFFNTLLLRTDLTGADTFREALTRVSQVLVEAHAHQDVPFERVLEEINKGRPDAHAPLFHVMFTFHNRPPRELELPGLTMSPYNLDQGVAKFDLLLNVSVQEDGLFGWLEYSTDLYDLQTMEKWVAAYQTLLERAVERPDIALPELAGTAKEMREPKLEKKAESPFKKKFGGAKAKTIQVAPGQLVKSEPVAGTNELVLRLEPAVPGLDLVEWAANNRDLLIEKLHTHGALLFRGFCGPSMRVFESFAGVFADELAEYRFRSTPRKAVEGRVYTSTEYPADQTIPQHNENSYAHQWPKKLWFHCLKAAETGGETPLADSQRVYQQLSDATKAKLIEKGVLYVRNYGDRLDLPWQEVFQTEDPSEVESFCRDTGLEFEWLPNGRLRTRSVRPAVVRHPVSGETVWFNQAHLFHVTSLPDEMQQALCGSLAEEDYPRNTYYGDGTPFEPDVLAEIRRVYDSLTVSFPWKEGDILMVDNLRCTHGRHPFTGERKVVVAMADIADDNS